MSSDISNESVRTKGSAGEVLSTFLKLGLTSFGGPIAHLGYFHREIVERRRWVKESDYAQLLGLCQFLPGPASSQLGFSLGLLRAGWAGALAAFVAFTLPSALILFAFALIFPNISGTIGDAAIHGLKLVALAVVADGVLRMARRLCPDVPRAGIAVFAVIVILLTGQAWIQLLVVLIGAALGLVFVKSAQAVEGDGLSVRYSPALGTVLIVIFFLLLFGLPFLSGGKEGLVPVVNAFYRAGALVFGGGHVVLPLLEDTVVSPGWISQSEFLAGYGAAQAVPGPMFTLASYLGASLPGAQGGIVGAGVALISIFLPGFLLLAGVLPMWQAIVSRPSALRAVAGLNAAVVGLLGAALYDPVWTSAVRSWVDILIAAVGFALLMTQRVSPIIVVIWCVLASVAGALLL